MGGYVVGIGDLYQGPGKYNYSLPEWILKKFYEGTMFGGKAYNDNDKKRVDLDCALLYQRHVPKEGVEPEKTPWAVISAGGPGSGKTTIMERDRNEKMAHGDINFAYVDPDAVCMKQMENTYLADKQKEEMTLAELYTKWRNASNFIFHYLLGNLVRLKQSFYMGTTAAAKETPLFFDLLKPAYKIRLIHVIAPVEVCKDSIAIRDKTFFQTTKEDIENKPIAVAERIVDYMKYADVIDFYYRDAAEAPALLVARYTADAADPRLRLVKLNQKGYDAMKKVHNAICDKLGRKDLLWEVAVEGKRPEEVKQED